MAHNYEVVQYSRSRIKRAGKVFVSEGASQVEREAALLLINNWRAAHAFPLQVVYVHLKRTTQRQNAIVAQRLKRLYSITQKLYRYPNMSLTAMQDIGGCRVIVDSTNEVYELVRKLKKSSMRHDQKEEYDYIAHPKEDGYRSYHMVLAYQSDRNPVYNGLFIEIQIRTHIQHLWATAVETMDTFTGDPLKNGRGSSENRQFFILASNLLKCFEDNNGNIETESAIADRQALSNYDKKHCILQKLKSIQQAVGYVATKDQKEQGYYILRLNRATNQLLVKPYKRQQIEEATEYYGMAEKSREEDEDVVLVSTASFSALQQAYPNYFSDISEFISLIDKAINGSSENVR